MRPLKIISGGQTGVERAAWDVAIELGIEWGGWVPKGRRAEDGVIPARYDRCVEHASRFYEHRTLDNVEHSDGTLIVAPSFTLKSGTLATQRLAHTEPRACMVAVPSATHIADVHEWLRDALSEWDGERGIRTLNIAGPRASKWPEGYEATKAFLREVLR